MENSLIHLNDVSVRFRVYHGFSSGIKEAVMRLFQPPKWYRTRPPNVSEFWGLKNISLELKEGDRLGIIGHNGAGKSTLLKVISRIYRPTRGQLTVRGRIAPLIEIGAGFNPELSGRENAYLNGAVLGLKRKVINERMYAIFEFAELKDFMDVPVKYYSTGMFLRLAFSIATEVAPDILILDELFAGADQEFLLKANKRLSNFIESSKILILVTHNFDYVRDYCTKALLLQTGEVVYTGTPNDVIHHYLSSNQRLPS